MLSDAYSCTQSFYHAQKAVRIDVSKWLSCRVSTMHVGLLTQFLHSENIKKLLDLLVSSQQYPLGSLQRNCFRSDHHELCDKDMFAELLVTGGSGGLPHGLLGEQCF